MAQQGGSVITVFNHLLGTSQQFINSDMEIQDINVVDNTLFVVDKHKFVSWDLGAAGASDTVDGAKRVVINDTLTIDSDARHLTLSHNCSQLAFTSDQTVFLYNLKAPGPITKYTSANIISGLQFSPDKQRLWLHTESCTLMDGYIDRYDASCWLVELQIVEGGIFGDVITKPLEDANPWAHLSPDGCRIKSYPSWVEDSGDNKLLWLPPSWRAGDEQSIKWNSNFLALVDGYHPKPIIIQFHP